MKKGRNTKHRITKRRKWQKVKNDKSKKWQKVENDKIYTVEWIPLLQVYCSPRNNIILG